MDSGGSGSLQSSSGGDDHDQEYDSAVSSLFASISNPNPNPIQPPTASSFFHPSPQPFSAPNPLLYNMDPVWSTTSDLPNFNHSLLTTPPNNNQSLLLASSNAAARVVPPPQPQGQGVATAEKPKNKNPKKRTRASRRAPTTVLTTDTSNFRQMVQEFTGIPAAPFSAAPFTRRLDLFGGPSNSDHVFAKEPQTLLNLQNPLFTFQSLLQQQQQQQQPIPDSSISNSVADGQQVNSSLGGFPRWRDHHEGEDQNLRDFEGNNESSQNVRGIK